MSNELLNYENVPPERPSAVRTTAWISLLVLGILYCLGGLCIGFSGVFMFAFIFKQADFPANSRALLLAVMVVLLALALAFGIVYLWSALRVRKGFRGAAVASLVIAILNTVVLTGLVCMGIIGVLLGPRGPDPSVLFGVIFYILPIAANGWVVFALTRFLRESKPATPRVF
jgi:hypothetical protein